MDDFEILHQTNKRIILRVDRENEEKLLNLYKNELSSDFYLKSLTSSEYEAKKVLSKFDEVNNKDIQFNFKDKLDKRNLILFLPEE